MSGCTRSSGKRRKRGRSNQTQSNYRTRLFCHARLQRRNVEVFDVSGIHLIDAGTSQRIHMDKLIISDGKKLASTLVAIPCTQAFQHMGAVSLNTIQELEA
jgi:hypothetical protein